MISTQFRPSARWLRAAAARMLIATAAVSLIAGCGDDNTRVNGGDNTDTQRINDALSRVFGRVVDSNNNPVPGALVSLAGMETTTNASGGYEFRDVPVVNVTGTDDNGNVGGIGLTVVAQPPEGQALLASGVLVRPQAQIDDSTDSNANAGSGGSGGSGGSASGGLGGDSSTGSIAGNLGGDATTDSTTDSTTVGDAGGAGGNASGGAGGSGGSGGSVSEDEGNGVITTFIDGLAAEAPPIVMPRLASGFTGTLRDENTGGVLAGVELCVDFIGQASQESVINTVTADSVQACLTTGDDGGFTFANNLPNNSCFNLYSPTAENVTASSNNNNFGCSQFTADSDNGQLLSSSNEGRVLALGTVEASPIMDQGDNTPPEIARVQGVINQNVGTNFPAPSAFPDDGSLIGVGLLGDSFDGTAATGGIVVTFTEAVTANLSPANVNAYDYTNEAFLPIAAVTVLNPTQIQIDFTNPIPRGAEFAIFLNTQQITDSSDNILADLDPFQDQGVNAMNNRSPFYVDQDVTSGVSVPFQFTAILLRTVGDPLVDADGTDVIQVDRDPGTLNDFADLQIFSDTFLDVADSATESSADGAGIITQLDQSSDSGVDRDGSSGRKDQYLRALNNTAAAPSNLAAGSNPVRNIVGNVGRAVFAPVDGVSNYRVTVARGGAMGSSCDVPASDFADPGTLLTSISDCTLGRVVAVGNDEATDGRTFGLVIGQISANGMNQVIVRPLDDLGIPSDEFTPLVLTDNVAISPSLQRSYQNLYDSDDRGETEELSGCFSTDLNVINQDVPNPDRLANVALRNGNAGVLSDAGSPNIGGSGEQAVIGVDATPGLPCLGIQPELLIAAQSEGATTDDDPYFDAFNALIAGNDPGIGDLTAGDPDVVISNRLESRPAYDAGAFDGWAAADRARSVKIGTTEDVDPDNVGPVDFLTAGAATTITNPRAQNNTTVGPLTTPGVPDGVVFDSNDVLSLANDDNGRTIVLSGNILDLAGNAADLDVVVKDGFPPMVTFAERNADGSLTITFNEDVRAPQGNYQPSIYLVSGNQTAGSPIPASALSVSGNTITVATADAVSTAFNGTGSYDDGTGTAPHFYVDTSEIEDLNGNAYEATSFDDDLTDEDGQTDSPLPSGDDFQSPLDTYPVFVGVDRQGPLSVTTTGNDNFSAGNTTFQFIVNTQGTPVFLMSGDAQAACGPTPPQTAFIPTSGPNMGTTFPVTGIYGSNALGIGDFSYTDNSGGGTIDSVMLVSGSSTVNPGATPPSGSLFTFQITVDTTLDGNGDETIGLTNPNLYRLSNPCAPDDSGRATALSVNSG